jgi:hypothetical protein
VKGDAEIIFDGGIRSGQDVLRATEDNDKSFANVSEVAGNSRIKI